MELHRTHLALRCFSVADPTSDSHSLCLFSHFLHPNRVVRSAHRSLSSLQMAAIVNRVTALVPKLALRRCSSHPLSLTLTIFSLFFSSRGTLRTIEAVSLLVLCPCRATATDAQRVRSSTARHSTDR